MSDALVCKVIRLAQKEIADEGVWTPDRIAHLDRLLDRIAQAFAVHDPRKDR